MFVFYCRCVSCAVRLGTAVVTWDRKDVLPDDGPVGQKHVGVIHHHHHHHHHLLLLLLPWIRSFDLFRHRRVAIFSWVVHDPFFPEVCR